MKRQIETRATRGGVDLTITIDEGVGFLIRLSESEAIALATDLQDDAVTHRRLANLAPVRTDGA